MIKRLCKTEKKAIGIFAAVLFVLVISSCSTAKSSRYARTFGTDELILNAGTTKISADSGYAGLFTSGPAVSLPAGDYEITVHYQAETDGNFIQLWTAHDNAENGNVIWNRDGALPASASECTFPVTLGGNISGLEICTFYGGSGSFAIRSITIRCISGSANVKDHLILPVLLFTVALVWYIEYRRIKPDRREGFLFVTCAVLIVSVPCYLPYLVQGHDMPFETNRIVGIANGLRSGQFPVRIHPSTYEGYGYAASVFYPELFLYIPAILYKAGLSLVSSVHVYLILIHGISATCMYFAAVRMTGSPRTAALAAILFTCASYRLVLAYLMNGYGSAMAIAFVPLVLYGFYEIMFGDPKRWLYLMIGMCGIMQSHVLTFVIVAGFLCAAFAVCLFFVRMPGRYLALAKSAVGTVLVNLWFLVPFFSFYFSEIQTESLAGDPAGRALSLVNLLSVWGHAGMGIQVVDKPATGVPALIDLTILIGVVCFLAFKDPHGAEKEKCSAHTGRIAAALLIVGVLAAYMTTKYFPWEWLQGVCGIGRFVQFIQHPQRILCVAVSCLSVTAACGYAKKLWGGGIMIPAVLAAALLTSCMFLQEYAAQPAVCARGEIMTSDAGTHEYLYPDTDTVSLDAARYHVSSEAVSFTMLDRTQNRITARVSAAQDGYVELPLFYYPGYRASINGEGRTIEHGENHVIRVLLGEGDSGELQVEYQESILWRLADGVSVLTVFSYLIWRIWNRKRSGVAKSGGSF